MSHDKTAPHLFLFFFSFSFYNRLGVISGVTSISLEIFQFKKMTYTDFEKNRTFPGAKFEPAVFLLLLCENVKKKKKT